MTHTIHKTAVAAALLGLTMTAQAASFIVEGTGDLAAAVAASGGKVVRAMPRVGAVLAEGDAAFKAKVAARAGVANVMPNIRVDFMRGVRTSAAAEALDPPNNPPGTIDSRFNLQWGHTAVRAVDAWNLGYQGQGARVAVLDGGFNLAHPDLQGQIDRGCSADMTGEGIEYGPNSDDATGVFSHGMHTAGTIAAGWNGFGTIGVAPKARLCLVKVLFNHGSGSFTDIVEGITFAADQGVDVISMSLGGAIYKAGYNDPAAPEDSYTAKDAAGYKNFVAKAVAYATKKGALVITSAGNDASNGDKDKALIHLPSDAPQSMSVSATAPVGWAMNPNGTFLDTPASYTNYGSSVISVAGPGGDAWESIFNTGATCTIGGLARACYVFDLVFSTGGVVNGAAYYYWSAGTSMATPHVSGVAALIVSKFGKMSPAKLRSKLERGADDLGKPGNDPFYGAGRVNALKSLMQ